mmetsp:Transcript_64969/g.120964  ORF Transcript_64969/g.120964 Transcript_64969/m.120964 type:complete len:653 (+) Transcript_64969:116-2074(+)
MRRPVNGCHQRAKKPYPHYMFFQGDEQGLDSFELEHGCRKNRWDTLLDALLKSMMMDGEWPREAKGYIFAGPDLLEVDGNVQPLAMPESGLLKEDGRKRYSPTTVRSWEDMLHKNCPIHNKDAAMRQPGLRWELGDRPDTPPGRRRNHHRTLEQAQGDLMKRLKSVIAKEASGTSAVLCLDYKGNDIVDYDALKAEGARALQKGNAPSFSNVFFLIGGAHGFDGHNDEDGGVFLQGVLEAFAAVVPRQQILTVTLATEGQRSAPKFTAAKVAAYLAVDYARDELRKIALGVEFRAKRGGTATAKLAPWARTEMQAATASAPSQCEEAVDGQAANVAELEQKLLERDAEICQLQQALCLRDSKYEEEAQRAASLAEQVNLLNAEAEVNEEKLRKLEEELAALRAASTIERANDITTAPQTEHEPQAQSWSLEKFGSPAGNRSRWADSLEDDDDDDNESSPPCHLPATLSEACAEALEEDPTEPQQEQEQEQAQEQQQQQEEEEQEGLDETEAATEEAGPEVDSEPGSAQEADTAESGFQEDMQAACQDETTMDDAGKDAETSLQECDLSPAEPAKVLEVNVEGKESSTTASEAHNSPKTPPPRRGWDNKVVPASWAAAAPTHESDPAEYPALGSSAGGKKKPQHPRRQLVARK